MGKERERGEGGREKITDLLEAHIGGTVGLHVVLAGVSGFGRHCECGCEVVCESVW